MIRRAKEKKKKQEEEEEKKKGGVLDINWETNVKGSTSHFKLCTEREVTRRQKSSTEGGVRFVCVLVCVCVSG